MSSSEEHDFYSDPLHTLLPEEILRLILSKISDPKTLLVSSLISKRIASILSHSESLSVRFPTRISCPGDLFLRLTKLLRIFNGVRSLRIELPCSCYLSSDDHTDDVFKWNTKICIGFGIFTFFCSKSVSRIDDEVEAEEEEEEKVDVDDFHIPTEIIGPVLCATSMHHLILLLIWQHPKLDSVELTDSKKHGKLSLQGAELVNLRRPMLLDSMPPQKNVKYFIGGPFGHQKVWYVPKLRLPLSGFVMKEVNLVAFIGDGVANGNAGSADAEDNASLDGGFEDDVDGIFGEAVSEIVTKHRFRATNF
ncbi:hypothetical protein RHGRI_031196 [Rhododendron griersonianum]|uniref:F-box domain-containing protein n=1 Tax=Rhododendron griersonianum TaxID=479676 RepID=A0AAV6I7S4_9ERIC|nr:hypothetical protein RHGRI_031196 [Rhododendron griersonianum]KAG5524453.1 hypothetical protein RHGRI_031196 [Rhododendron griersonianum]